MANDHDAERVGKLIEDVVKDYEDLNSSVNHFRSFWDGLGPEIIHALDKEGYSSQKRKISPPVDDPSTRKYVELHDHEFVTVEKVLIVGIPWFIIAHRGNLSENEFYHKVLVTEEEAFAIAEAIQTAEVNPVPEGA